MYKKRVIAVILIIIFVLFVAPYIIISNYPRIVRGAYYKDPRLVYTAVYEEYFKSKSVSRSQAFKKVKDLGFVPKGEISFLYLAHEPNPKIDTPIIDRYFSTVAKWSIDTSADTFWQIPVHSGLVFVEASSGRLIYLEKDKNRDYQAEPIYID